MTDKDGKNMQSLNLMLTSIMWCERDQTIAVSYLAVFSEFFPYTFLLNQNGPITLHYPKEKSFIKS